MNWNRYPDIAVFFSIDVVAAVDSQELPAMEFQDCSKFFAWYRLHRAISTILRFFDLDGVWISTERHPSIASWIFSSSSSIVSPCDTHPGIAGTSAQKPPSSASWTTIFIFTWHLARRLYLRTWWNIITVMQVIKSLYIWISYRVIVKKRGIRYFDYQNSASGISVDLWPLEVAIRKIGDSPQWLLVLRLSTGNVSNPCIYSVYALWLDSPRILLHLREQIQSFQDPNKFLKSLLIYYLSFKTHTIS